MLQITADYYLVIKSLHLISVVSWLVGMLYLPRLFVYHTTCKKNGEADNMLKIMESKLYRYIMTPAMIASLFFGIWLIFIIGFENLGIWFHIKILLLIFLFACHGLFGKFRKDFINGTNTKSTKFFRIINEVPTFFMVAIILLAVIKPF